MKQFYFRITCILIFISSAATPVFSQLSVATVPTAQQLAQSLVGFGVTISNVTLNCPGGAWGSFNGTSSNIGMNGGILLASGSINNAVGPNVSGGITTDFGAPGDPDLTALAGSATHDACVLEFDLVPCDDTVHFNYVFGSDEYSEFVNSFNDIFAFFISGPGYAVPTNIALVPVSGMPVSINNVNCLNSSPYYICNDPNNSLCAASYNCPTSSVGTTVEYDGFTIVLTANAVVTPGATYHLKLAVADAIDGVLDSGVFIQAGSLTAGNFQINSGSGYFDPGLNAQAVVEDCVPGIFTVCTSIINPIDTTFIPITITGSAVNGVDYQFVNDTIMILPGDSCTTINIIAPNDNMNEGVETMVIHLQGNACTGSGGDSTIIYILDHIEAVASPDTTICQGDSVQLHVNFGPNFNWTPSTGLSCSTCQNPMASPPVTTTYYVTVSFAGCSATDTVVVTVNNPNPVGTASGGGICLGESFNLLAFGVNSYSWSPAGSLSNASIANPVATPNATTTYTVTGVNGCATSNDTVIVTVHQPPTIIVLPDTSVCPLEPVQLQATGASTYHWVPNVGISNNNSSNPLAILINSTTYTITGTSAFGCIDSTVYSINIYSNPTANAGTDISIYLGQNTQLQASGGSLYSWNPTTFLDNPSVSNPICTPTVTTTYVVTVTSTEGCISYDTIVVKVLTDALVFVPTAFSPNNDGKNDVLNVITLGIFNLDKFRVYNRWGQLIYETNDITKGWDGTYNGEPAEVGAYVYIVSGYNKDQGFIEQHGNVTLLR